MRVKILEGKKIAEKILTGLKIKIKKSKLKLTLAVIQVGKNPISQIFINQKKKACQRVDIGFRLFKFPSEIKAEELKKEIEKIVKNQANSGVIIQLPLPKKFLAEEFLNLIPEKKDIDCLSEKSLGKYYQGISKILPPVVGAVIRLLKNYQIKLKGKNVTILGAGRLVGFPLTIQLLKEKATISVLNEFTKETIFFTKKADILISGTGKPNLIKGEMVKKGAIIIDAGCSLKKGRPRTSPALSEKGGAVRGRLVGDVNFQSVSKKTSYITPVPGGVGPMTIACLLENLVLLYEF